MQRAWFGKSAGCEVSRAEYTVLKLDAHVHESYSIVFIHGLRGHPRETWETPAAHTPPQDNDQNLRMRSICWIKDLLPKDIPDARIVTYGYNADVIPGLFEANGQNSISRHGKDLKAKLERRLENKVS